MATQQNLAIALENASASMMVGEILAIINPKWQAIFDKVAKEQTRRREAGEQCPPIITMVAERHPEVLPIKDEILRLQSSKRTIEILEAGEYREVKLWPDSTPEQKLEAAAGIIASCAPYGVKKSILDEASIGIAKAVVALTAHLPKEGEATQSITGEVTSYYDDWDRNWISKVDISIETEVNEEHLTFKKGEKDLPIFLKKCKGKKITVNLVDGVAVEILDANGNVIW